MKMDTAVDGVRDHVVKSIMRLGEMLKPEDLSRAKEALAKHVGKLVLTPVEHDGRPVYQSIGERQRSAAGGYREVSNAVGGQGRNRTADASLFRAALYRLSYLAANRLL